ncbi:aminotransferase class I/II-fold pyridoxal phosphate-dependent enzyme [Kitasatospora sp. NBC_01250]|uniref:pyridoxal phosphate-dependent decarboxylase family protein n=1 Tax=Kitasatospora sp. NBC_01250 TaxID=2903571 RepID=UPI002E354A54|nr:aminotransferase class I/II-fold pyridoxal phosphate-dependent enzyme [Kitasatospora sp. NBC_01250]
MTGLTEHRHRAVAVDPAALAGGEHGPTALRPLLEQVLAALAAGAARRGGPVTGGDPRELAERVARAARAPSGAGALGALTELLAHGAADPADPACAAHLHCPPLAVAVAADLAVSALNPSLDSWDQAPAATVLETELLAELAALVGYRPDRAAGVLTSGGTESNLLGLLLARDRLLPGQPELTGVDPARRPRVFASRAAHFSIQRAAAVLGLGERAVVPIEVDRDQRMDPGALARALTEARRAGQTPLAVVATAGTTDTGAIDPLTACAELAADHGAWLHVDAAYGGGALLSARLAPLLAGLELADSVSLDWHKLGWQPVAAGVFLVRRAESYDSLARRAAYLNPADDEEAGYPSLLGRSLRTTRRADAFSLAVTLRTLGHAGLGALVDRCRELALAAAGGIRARVELELHGDPLLTTVLFRQLPGDPARRADPAAVDAFNAALRRRLLATGRAVLGRTELPCAGGRAVAGQVRLKLTLLNPQATEADLERLLDLVVLTGRELDRAGE